MTHKGLPDVSSLKGTAVRFWLGTDAHIDEGTVEQQETRVGVTPEQVRTLREWLKRCGIYLDFAFLQGAGIRAGFTDGEYLKVGGRVIFEHQLPSLPAPDVFHALKEPAVYESFISGPFIRIGALHSGAFDPTSGLASLLRRRCVAGILDGSEIGGHSLQPDAGSNIPIRSSMSLFAGQIAADEVGRRLLGRRQKVPVVISGAGVAGMAAAIALLGSKRQEILRIVIVEINEERAQSARVRLAKFESRVSVTSSAVVSRQLLKDAGGLILTAFKKGHPAPKVVQLSDLSVMSEGGTIVDVSIDEKGGINVPNFDFTSASLQEVIKTVKNGILELKRGVIYIGDSHLPRRYPSEASLAHGEAVLPYLGVLLYLCAQHRGPHAAVRALQAADPRVAGHSRLDSLKCDLKNGLAFARPDIVQIHPDRVGLMAAIEGFLRQEGMTWTFDGVDSAISETKSKRVTLRHPHGEPDISAKKSRRGNASRANDSNSNRLERVRSTESSQKHEK